MRVPEALACKKLLLTERIPAVEEFFVDGKDLVLFNTIDEAVEKARYYLAHDEERNKIAEAGYSKFLKGWTYMDRAKTILDICLGWRPSDPNSPAYVPEYDRRGSLIPSSAIDYHLLSHLYDGQSQKKEEVVLDA